MDVAAGCRESPEDVDARDGGGADGEEMRPNDAVTRNEEKSEGASDDGGGQESLGTKEEQQMDPDAKGGQ